MTLGVDFRCAFPVPRRRLQACFRRSKLSPAPVPGWQPREATYLRNDPSSTHSRESQCPLPYPAVCFPTGMLACPVGVR